MAKAKSEKKLYFGPEAQEAIIKYNATSDLAEKNRIFRAHIYQPLRELVDNLMLVHRIKCSVEIRENIRDECVSHLVCSLNRFDPSLGKKAFSYYDVIAKHWLINFARKQQRQLNEQKQVLESERKAARTEIQGGHSEYLGMAQIDDSDEDVLELDKHDIEELRYRLVELRDKIKTSKDFFDMNKNKHGRNLWKTISAVIYLLETCDQIPTINKKSVRAYLKEISGLKSNQLTASLKLIKPTYSLFMEEKIREFNGDLFDGLVGGEEDGD